MKKRIWCFIGPSASGKTTLVRKAIEGINSIVPNTIGEVISVTTKEPRKEEVNGVDYFFLTKEEFKKLDLAEHAEYAGNSYGITKDEVNRILSNYKNLFVVVSIDGYNQLKEAYGDEVGSVFLECPKYILERRLEQRGDSPELIKSRLANMEAEKELENGKYCDYTYINLWPYRTDDETYHEFLGLCINKLNVFKKSNKKLSIPKLEGQTLKFSGIVLTDDDVVNILENNNIEFIDLCKDLSNKLKSNVLLFGDYSEYKIITDIYMDKEEILLIGDDSTQILKWLNSEYNCEIEKKEIEQVYILKK